MCAICLILQHKRSKTAGFSVAMGTNGKNAAGLRKENTVTVNRKTNSQMKIRFLLLVMFGLAGIQTAWAKDGKDSLYILLGGPVMRLP